MRERRGGLWLLTGARRFLLDDSNLHVLDLDAHKKEIDLSHYNVTQMIPGQ